MQSPFGSNVSFSHEQYMVLEELGRGGMGIVYRCTDRKMLKDVAVKVIGWNMSNDEVIRFHKEAKALAKLQHPNILGVQHFGHSDDDSLFLVMDLLTGRSLADLLEQDKHPSFEDSLSIFIQLCDGLAHAHGKGILHRDIKPSNVFVARYEAGDLQVTITDFGLAKLLTEDQHLTKTGISLGTPQYMSPEQCDGKPVDERSDQYSLGCLMFEVLTGQKPYDGANIPHILMQHIKEPAPTLKERAPERNYPDEMDRILAKCLAKDPQARYSRLRDLRADLVKLKETTFNVSFADDGGAYSPAEAFLRTGAFIISGFQNLTRPSQEKKFVSLFVIIAIVFGGGVAYFSYALWQQRMADNKELESYDQWLAGKKKKTFFLDHKDTGIILTRERGPREPGRFRDGQRLWIPFSKHTSEILKSYANASQNIAKVAGEESHPDWLKFSGSDVTDADMELVAKLHPRGVLLSGTAITDKGLERLSKIPSIEELYLNDTKVTDAGIKHFEGHPILQLIALTNTNTSDASVEVLSTCGKLSYVQFGKKVTGKNADLMINNSDLFHIGFPATSFDLSNLPKLKDLTIDQLDLSNLKLQDKDMNRICKAKFKALHALFLNNNPDLTDKGLITLAHELNGVSTLHIAGCNKITDAGIKQFHDFRLGVPIAVFKTDE